MSCESVCASPTTARRESGISVPSSRGRPRSGFASWPCSGARGRTLLELGAGPGKDGEFFRGHGLDVVCTDLSPEMIELCESKGLAARVMDLSDLDFPSDAFDAVYALNCLLHLPGRELPAALRGIRTVLKPGGLFYLGVYGGKDHEGVWAGDPYEPKRFFSFHTDEHLGEMVTRSFDICSFRRTAVATEQAEGLNFQSLILRKRQCDN